MGINLRVAQQYRNEKGKLPKETDGDWMRYINFDALNAHVTEVLLCNYVTDYLETVSDTLTN